MRVFFRKLHNFFMYGEFGLRPAITRWDDYCDQEEPEDRWWVACYWAIRRFWANSLWCDWPYAFRKVKWFIQRGRRGWADCDTWGLDSYITRWMPDALRHLKETKHGIPAMMFEETDPQLTGAWGDDIDWETPEKKAEAKWDAIMDKMIAAFEANDRMDGVYEEELGKYPLYRPAGVSREAWEAIKDDHHQKIQELAKRDQAIWEEGAALFVKYFNNLWD